MEMFTTDNRVNPDFIRAELEEVEVSYYQPPGTFKIVATAIDQDGFVLGTAVSGCVDPDNYYEERGREVALQEVLVVAENKLWELYGFLLHKKLVSE